jgi:methyl-accepting chemotaxis protein
MSYQRPILAFRAKLRRSTTKRWTLHSPIFSLSRPAIRRPVKTTEKGIRLWQFQCSAGDAAAKLAALDKSQAVIEFQLDGTIITANANFCSALGYDLAEIKGKHHSMFCDPAYAATADYREFWAKLNRGEFQAAQYKRMEKAQGDLD